MAIAKGAALEFSRCDLPLFNFVRNCLNGFK